MEPILFSLKEFLITQPKNISLEIADKLYKYHIIPMVPVRNELGLPMTASKNSGYRPEWWEKKRKRSGNSQHVFRGYGAVDWTCEDFPENKAHLLALIIKHTEYTRMAVYNSFIHCDYKESPSGKREIYESTPKSEWTFLRYAKQYNTI